MCNIFFLAKSVGKCTQCMSVLNVEITSATNRIEGTYSALVTSHNAGQTEKKTLADDNVVG